MIACETGNEKIPVIDVGEIDESTLVDHMVLTHNDVLDNDRHESEDRIRGIRENMEDLLDG